jgi:fructose-1,6-bisphosphatase/inositol monophosphatase family enzyme
MTSDPLSRWPELVAALRDAIDSEWSRAGPLRSWRKSRDGQAVSDLDLRLDLAIREVLQEQYPWLPVLSEELGWLFPTASSSTGWVAVVDPVDGTDSLIQGRSSWWSSVALLEDGKPRAGLLYQPITKTTHDSRAEGGIPPARHVVGLSPDRFHSAGAEAMRGYLERNSLSLVAIPHAAEKVAAVVEGRCDACIYLPSRKSPGWHSWDLAASLAVVSASGATLRAVDGSTLLPEDLAAYRQVPWICARDTGVWEVVRGALAGWVDSRPGSP